MNQLSELNNATYAGVTEAKEQNESFCSEMTLQSRGERSAVSGKQNHPQEVMNSKAKEKASRERSHHVMKLIERQILRDISHQLGRPGAKRGKKEGEGEAESSTKTHSDELPGGMKVFITKTTHPEGAKSGKEKLKKGNHILPFINSSKNQSKGRKSKPEQYEWSLEDPRQKKTQSLPMMNGVRVQVTKQHGEHDIKTPPVKSLSSQTSTHHGERSHHSLPKIQEEPDLITQVTERREGIIMKDASTDYSPEMAIVSPNTSPDATKVKLPILGKRFGQQKELNYEGTTKFTKPSLGEIKRIIHGLYGDYFDSTLERYYTYEKQLHEVKNGKQDEETPLHYITPAWDETEPAASHTLRLFNSGSKRLEENDKNHKDKGRKISVPLLRSKYGKAVATSHKGSERRNRRATEVKRVTHSQPVIRSTGHPLGEVDVRTESITALRSFTPNTPEREHELRHYIAHQVALYHEQIARERRSRGVDSLREDKHLARYIIEENEGNELVSQFSSEIDRYAQQILNLESYLEAKRQHSMERKAKLREIKKKQKEKREQQKNKYLEVVEQRDAFLAQVSNSQRKSDPPTTPVTSGNEVTFEYIHDDKMYEKTPITKIREPQSEEAASLDISSKKQPMETKIYRIFGDRKKSSGVQRFVAQTPIPFTSRIIKRQVLKNSKDKNKPIQMPQQQQRPTRQRAAYKARLMTDLVSRFQVATRYKLDKEYVASLAYGTS